MMRALAPHCLLPFTAAWYRWRPSIRVLMYHRVARLPAYDQLAVTPEQFDRQMSHLAACARTIGLPQALDELASGEAIVPGVAVTFDDGYLDNLREALPILRRHRIPATIFVTTEFCDQSRCHPRYPGEPGRLHLDWDEVRSLAAEPGITIGSHTMTHPFLTRVDEAQARAEIADSRKLIERRTGRQADILCYPSGDFAEREVSLAREAGYRAAVSVAPGANDASTPSFALRRTEITDRDGPREFALKLAGAFDPLHAWLHNRRERNFRRAREFPPDHGNRSRT